MRDASIGKLRRERWKHRQVEKRESTVERETWGWNERSAPLFLAWSRGRKCTKQNERERKKEYLILLKMNSNSTIWASYCSSAWEVRPNVEATVSYFDEFFCYILAFYIVWVYWCECSYWTLHYSKKKESISHYFYFLFAKHQIMSTSTYTGTLEVLKFLTSTPSA